MKNYLSQNNLIAPVILLIPAILLIFLFLHFKKKKKNESNENNKFGRRGKKDHIWQILKEYHRKVNKTGSIIKESFVFERPHPSDLHDAIVRSFIFLDKKEAKQKGTKYKKTKYPKRFDQIEDYFEKLEEETKSLHKKMFEISHKLENIRQKASKKPQPRKRYVILYKVQQKEEISDWLSIEVELIKQPNKQGESKDVVVVNKELPTDMEMTWIAPLLNEKIEERRKQQNIELRRLKNIKRKQMIISKAKKFFIRKETKSN